MGTACWEIDRGRLVAAGGVRPASEAGDQLPFDRHVGWLDEFHGSLREIDRMYDAYVELFTELDPTCLLSPCSHLYYGSGLYGDRHQYYNDDRTKKQDGKPVGSSHGITGIEAPLWKGLFLIRK